MKFGTRDVLASVMYSTLALALVACAADESEPAKRVSVSPITGADSIEDVEQQPRAWNDGAMCDDSSFESCDSQRDGRSADLTFIYFSEGIPVAQGFQELERNYGEWSHMFVSLRYSFKKYPTESHVTQRVPFYKRDSQYLVDGEGYLAGVHGWIPAQSICPTIAGSGEREVVFRHLWLGPQDGSYVITLRPSWVTCR